MPESSALALFQFLLPTVTTVVNAINKIKARNGGVEPTVDEIVAQIHADKDEVVAFVDGWEAANPKT